MFDSLKTMGALAGLMKNKDALKNAGERIKARLGELRASGASGGGAVRATVAGDLRLVSLTLEPPVLVGLSSGDPASISANKAMIEQMIVEAVNNATDIAKVMAQREMSKEAEAMGLPDIFAGGGLDGLLGSSARDPLAR